MAIYRLYCLGRPFLKLDGSPVKMEMRKSLALLVYLRMAERDDSRESLAALFWPEYDQQHALANLRRTLSSLNKSLPGDLFAADREKISLKDHQTVWLDVEEFKKLRSVPKDHTHPADQACPGCLHSLEEAIQLYRGDFLEGFTLGDCTEFEEWQFLQSEDLRQELAGALQKAAEGYAANQNWERAIPYARQWVSLDRLHETAQRFLISLYEQAGQRSAGLRQYDELERILQDELGQQPDPETSALYLKIRDETATPAANKIKEPPKQTAVPPSLEPLLKTKLYIPSSRREKVNRKNLILALNQIEQVPLVILSAPAGFGKTTTLVEWVSQTSLPVAWYSLDRDDNEVGRFLNYFIAALESIHSGIGMEAQFLLRLPQPASPQLVLTHLLHGLEGLRNPLVIVLDDYQWITSQVVHEAVSFFLDHLPPETHIIIATRADPPLKLARLRLSGQLLEIRTNDLRFSPEEAFDYLTQVMRLPLTKDDIALLDKKIEGWIAGLQMAALSMRDHEDLQGFIKGFSGTNRYILDYLLEEVLASQPVEIQRFLLYTSILERLTAPLCDAVLANEKEAMSEGEDRPTGLDAGFDSQSASTLEYLERANLFLVSLDNERIWFRYHPLFTDLLRARLQRSLGLEGVAQLHVRASEWHAQNGSIFEAINHASAASDDERFERYVEQNYMELVNRGEQSWLRSWTGKLSEELVYRRPWLCIYEAYSHSWFGEIDKADRLLEEAEKLIRLDISTPDARSMQGLLAYVKSRVTALRGDLQRAIAYCLKAREYIPANNLALQLDTQITLGYEYFLVGDYANASLILSEMIQSGISSGAVINTVAASCVLARLQVIQGQLHKAYDSYQIAAKLIPKAGGEHQGARALVEIGIADLLFEWNDLDEALSHLKQGLDLLPFWGKADDFALAYITLARIHLARVNRADAIEAVEKATHLIQTSGVFPEARNAVKIAQVNLWLDQGEVAKAAEWLKEHQVNKIETIPVWHESEDITSIRVLLRLGRYTEAQVRIAQIIMIAEEGGRNKRLIEMLILQALAWHATGKDPEALDILQKALALSQPEGFVRVFLDEGQIMERLLMCGKEQGRWDTSPIHPYVRILLDAFKSEKISS
jgi:LuxR family maltose regulon positive regulatory protein